MKKNRAEIVKSIKLAWSSLRSHLPFCDKMNPKERVLRGNEQFHRRAVKDYAEIIKTLTEQL